MNERSYDFFPAIPGKPGFQGIFYVMSCLFFVIILITGCERSELKYYTEQGISEFSEIEKVLPGDRESQSPVNPLIAATFIDNYPAKSKVLDLTLTKGAAEITGSMSMSGSAVAFLPSNDLEPGTEYVATLRTKAANEDGIVKENRYSWKFRTGNHRQDYSKMILSVAPADGEVNVPVETNLTVTFTKEISPLLSDITRVSLRRGYSDVRGVQSVSGNIITFDPETDLQGGSTYYARVTFGSSSGYTSGGSNNDGDDDDDDDDDDKGYFSNQNAVNHYSWDFKTTTSTGGADVTAPTVVSVVPAANATSVASGANVTATFSEPLSQATVNTSTFTLKKGATAVQGTVTVSGSTAQFSPSAGLDPGSVYTATLTTGIKDVAGNSFAAAYSWNFTTSSVGDNTPPTVLSTVPAASATGVSVSSSVTATFSESMSSASLTTATFTLKQGTTTVSGSVTLSGATATFTPASQLAGNVAYTATITTGAKDAAGNSLAAEYSWNFTTSAVPDNTPPTVLSTVPAAGATAVAVNALVTATFSESMSSASITTATFTLKQGTTTVAGSVSYTGTTATFTPSGPLAGGTTYTAAITTGAKDVSGNALAATKTWTFTTVVTAPAGLSFANDVVPVLGLCNNCHTHNWTPSTNASTFYTNLVNAGYVNPTSYTTSKIYVKLSGGHPGSSIPATEVNKVLNWMKEGSKNN